MRQLEYNRMLLLAKTYRNTSYISVQDLKFRSDWPAFGVNFLFLLGTHTAKWVQHPLKNETHASNLRLMARQSERGLSVH